MASRRDDPTIVQLILSSGEATFGTHGLVDRQNCRYWLDENPHWMQSCTLGIGKS